MCKVQPVQNPDSHKWSGTNTRRMRRHIQKRLYIRSSKLVIPRLKERNRRGPLFVPHTFSNKSIRTFYPGCVCRWKRESTFIFFPRASSKKKENFKGYLARSQCSCGGQFNDERPESLRPRRIGRPGIKTSHGSQVSGAGSIILDLSSPGRAENLNTVWPLGRQSGKWTSLFLYPKCLGPVGTVQPLSTRPVPLRVHRHSTC